MSASAIDTDCRLDKVPLSAEVFGDLVGGIYQGTLDSPPWARALARLRDALQAYPVALVLRPAAPHQRAMIVVARKDNIGLSLDEVSGYGAFGGDVFHGMVEDQIVPAEELVGEERWLHSDFFRSWVKPYSIRYQMAAKIRGSDGSICDFRICRPPQAQPFSARDRTICQALIPHFKHALGIYGRILTLQAEQSVYADTVDRLLVGTVLLDAKGRVVRMNRIAEDILAERDGLSFTRAGLEIEDKEARHVIGKAIGRAIEIAAGRIAAGEDRFPSLTLLPRPSGREAMRVRVCPLPLEDGGAGHGRPAAALLIRDPERRARLGESLARRLFGLTPAEAALAQCLTEGLTLDEAAARLGVRKNTVRAQLTAIFGKAGVTRQSSLVSLLLHSSEFL